MEKQTLPLVSIIVPFFNVEQYIDSCIVSIFKQDYQHIELILIDDCGSDKSSKIVEEYQQKAPAHIDFRILKHPHNKGLSAARNTGTKAALGNYILYVDSDDRLFPNTVSLMMSQALKNDADMVVGDYVSMRDDEIVDSTVPENTVEGVISGTINILECYCRHGFYMMAWNKLVRASLLRDNHIEFIEGIIHEDNPWSMSLAFLMKRIVVLRKNTYVYTVRPGSIVTDSKIEQKRKSWYCGLLSYIKNINEHPQFKDNYVFHNFVVSEILSYLFLVGRNFNRQVTLNVLRNLDALSYNCKYGSPFTKSLPITHRIYNLMLVSPTWMRFLLLKLILAFK